MIYLLQGLLTLIFPRQKLESRFLTKKHLIRSSGDQVISMGSMGIDGDFMGKPMENHRKMVI